jgi:transporter family-2 protein
MNPLLLALAFAAGVAIATQAAVNSQLAAGLGGVPIVAAFLSFVIGTIALGAMAATSGGLVPALDQLGGQPLWRFAGGLLGAGAIFCTVTLAPRLGLAPLLALVIAGQLLASITIDHFGLLGVVTRPATAARLIGATVMLAGVLIALFGDRLLAAHRA